MEWVVSILQSILQERAYFHPLASDANASGAVQTILSKVPGRGDHNNTRDFYAVKWERNVALLWLGVPFFCVGLIALFAVVALLLSGGAVSQ